MSLPAKNQNRESKYVEMKTHQVCKEWWHGLLHRSTVESTVINLREAIISCSGAAPPPFPCTLVVLITLSYNYSCNHMQCEDPTKYHGAFPCSLSVVTLMNRARCCWSPLSYTLPPPKQSHHAICLMHQISPLSLLSIDLHHHMITTIIISSNIHTETRYTMHKHNVHKYNRHYVIVTMHQKSHSCFFLLRIHNHNCTTYKVHHAYNNYTFYMCVIWTTIHANVSHSDIYACH